MQLHKPGPVLGENATRARHNPPEQGRVSSRTLSNAARRHHKSDHGSQNCEVVREARSQPLCRSCSVVGVRAGRSLSCAMALRRSLLSALGCWCFYRASNAQQW